MKCSLRAYTLKWERRLQLCLKSSFAVGVIVQLLINRNKIFGLFYRENRHLIMIWLSGLPVLRPPGGRSLMRVNFKKSFLLQIPGWRHAYLYDRTARDASGKWPMHHDPPTWSWDEPRASIEISSSHLLTPRFLRNKLTFIIASPL